MGWMDMEGMALWPMMRNIKGGGCSLLWWFWMDEEFGGYIWGVKMESKIAR